MLNPRDQYKPVYLFLPRNSVSLNVRGHSTCVRMCGTEPRFVRASENAHRERRTQADTHLHTIAGRTVTRQDEEATESKWDAAFLATGFSHACQYFKSTLCRDIC